MNKISTKSCTLKFGACFYFFLFAKTLSSTVFTKCCLGKLLFFNRAALKLQKSKQSGITATVFRFTDDTKRPE